MSGQEPDYVQWVTLREYLHNARIELRDPQVRQWVRQWTEQIDNRLTISGQSYRVCSTCNRGGHHCPGCGADVRHGEIACYECFDRAPRTRDEVLDERMKQEREIPVSQLVSGDSVYSPSTKTWHEVRRSTAGQLYFRRDERWMPVGFAADVKFLTRRGDTGAAAGALFDAFGGEVIEG